MVDINEHVLLLITSLLEQRPEYAESKEFIEEIYKMAVESMKHGSQQTSLQLLHCVQNCKHFDIISLEDLSELYLDGTFIPESHTMILNILDHLIQRKRLDESTASSLCQ